MVDLHCHILPKMDDGAKSVQEAIELLKMQQRQGFERVVATPHYYIQKERIDEFLKRRNESVNLLCKDEGILDIEVYFKMGAEVFYSSELINTDLKKLCIEKTNYLLIELPTTYKPVNLEQFFYELRLKGIRPIIAHIERYKYLINDYDLIYDLVEGGVIVQVNATSLIRDKKMSKTIIKLIECNLVHLIATDTHNLEKRPPQMPKAIRVLKKKISISKLKELVKNSINVFDGKEIDVSNIKRVKKSIF